MTDVVIVGGGISGLAAAVDLARRGRSGLLLEQAPKLGGRCSSYRDPVSGDMVDNGQHVLLGAYHNLLRYLEWIGTRHHLKEEERLALTMHHPTRGLRTFRLKKLPRPLHLLAGMIFSDLLPFGDRLAMLRVGRFLQQWDDRREIFLAGQSVETWLIGLGQSREARRAFWYPIAVSVMNELPERASALLFARALRAAFTGSVHDSAVLIPRVGQTELYVDGALEFLRGKGFTVRSGSEAESLLLRDGRAAGVRLKGGEVVDSHCVVSAVPPHALKRLLPAGHAAALDRFSSSPIISIHLWFDQEFMEEEFVGLLDRTIQWLFNRTRLVGSSAGAVSAVISAAYDTIDLPKEELVARTLDDIHAVYPSSRSSRLLSSVVIKEKRATFSAGIEIERARPAAAGLIGGLYLAGDWTATGLPATIEGAVQSGFAASALVDEELRSVRR